VGARGGVPGEACRAGEPSPAQLVAAVERGRDPGGDRLRLARVEEDGGVADHLG
jgi:hypothetical protein